MNGQRCWDGAVADRAPAGRPPFDATRHVDADGEWYSARELMPSFGHENWYRFQEAIKRARSAVVDAGQDADQYIGRYEIHRRSMRPLVDYRLSSGGVQLVAIHAIFPMEAQCQRCGALIVAHRASRRFCESCQIDHRKPTRERTRPDRSYKVRKVGLTLAEYDAMVLARGGLCDICGKKPVEQRGSLCVDHDHETNTIRGLLCSPCNRGLGLLGDTAESVGRAARYLAEHEAAHVQGRLALVSPVTRKIAKQPVRPARRGKRNGPGSGADTPTGA